MGLLGQASFQSLPLGQAMAAKGMQSAMLRRQLGTLRLMARGVEGFEVLTRVLPLNGLWFYGLGFIIVSMMVWRVYLPASGPGSGAFRIEPVF